jgi:hypothetical protein
MSTIRNHIQVLSLLSFFFIHLFTRAYIVWVISPSCPHPPPSPPSPPHFLAEPVLPFSPVLLKSKNTA